jgi:hypothetical protein
MLEGGKECGKDIQRGTRKMGSEEESRKRKKER